MSDRYEQLKSKFTKEITDDGNSDRHAVERKITRLRDDFFEKLERLMQSVKDVKAGQDTQLTQRALGRLQEEKAALDDAILDVLEKSKNVILPRLDEATHKARRALGIPHRQANIVPAAIKATLSLLISLAVTVGPASVAIYFQSKGRRTQSAFGPPINPEVSFGDYISYVSDADIFKFGSPEPRMYWYWLFIALVLASAWCGYFALFRRVR